MDLDMCYFDGIPGRASDKTYELLKEKIKYLPIKIGQNVRIRLEYRAGGETILIGPWSTDTRLDYIIFYPENLEEDKKLIFTSDVYDEHAHTNEIHLFYGKTKIIIQRENLESLLRKKISKLEEKLK